MNTVYVMNVTPLLSEENKDRVMRLLSEDRRARLSKIKQPMDRARVAAAGLLLAHAVRLCDAKPGQDRQGRGEFHLDTAPGGKPYFKDRPGLFFSISHSGDYAVCALSGREVGVDLQKRQAAGEGVARRILNGREWEEYRVRRESCEDALIPFWSAKEAFVKYTGEGISRDFRDLYVDFSGRRVTDLGTGRSARLCMPAAPEGYVLALCREMGERRTLDEDG